MKNWKRVIEESGKVEAGRGKLLTGGAGTGKQKNTERGRGEVG